MALAPPRGGRESHWVNAYAVFILSALVAEYALRLVANLLNLRALSPKLPEEFADAYDSARYRRSQAYTRARTQFGLLVASFRMAVFLGFWWAGGFGWLDGVVRGLGLSSIATGLLFVGALGMAQSLLSLPFRGYSTFVIEERFGFNRTTPRTFLFDELKGLLLTLVLGCPLLASVLWCFEAAGPLAWLWCWLVTTGFLLFVQFIAPTWIFPLFNKFKPLPEGELREAMTRYAEKASFPLEGLFVIDGSRRSTKANAFFTGFGKHKRVALFDTLIEKHAPDELVAIVAHEIGHYKKQHIAKGLAISVVHTGIAFFLLSIFLESDGLFEAFHVAESSVHAGLVFFAILFSPIELVLSVAVHGLSRRNEFEADAYARETGLARALICGLKRLSAESLANLTPHPLYVALHDSHPPLRERISALQRDEVIAGRVPGSM